MSKTSYETSVIEIIFQDKKIINNIIFNIAQFNLKIFFRLIIKNETKNNKNSKKVTISFLNFYTQKTINVWNKEYLNPLSTIVISP